MGRIKHLMDRGKPYAELFSAGVALIAAAIALVAVVVTWQIAERSDQRVENAEARIMKAEREAHAAMVVFHVEAVGDPQVSREVLGDFMVVANFGQFPIEEVSIEDPQTVDIAGKAEKVVYTTPIGTIGPCYQASIQMEDGLVEGHAVFMDINGITWSRRPGTPPVEGHPEGHPVLDEQTVHHERIENCGD